jgi:hypothetical protein
MATLDSRTTRYGLPIKTSAKLNGGYCPPFNSTSFDRSQRLADQIDLALKFLQRKD